MVRSTYRPYDKLSKSQRWRRKKERNYHSEFNAPITHNSAFLSAETSSAESISSSSQKSTTLPSSKEEDSNKCIIMNSLDKNSASTSPVVCNVRTNLSNEDIAAVDRCNVTDSGPCCAESINFKAKEVALTRKMSLRQDIASWALLEKNVPKTAIASLLKILSRYHEEIPLSVASLFPPSNLRYESMLKGEYVHVANWIVSLKNLISYQAPETNLVHLLVNVDGLPLFKSSPDYRLYPILVKVLEIKSRPICVGIYCSNKSMDREMPPPDIFLKSFLDDVKSLAEDGLKVHDKVYLLKNCVTYICDAPARASLKLIKGHSAYNSCERCTITGEYHDYKVCFIGEGERRTDISFKNQVDEMHHKGVSVLAQSADMVSSFVLDSMHMVYLGIVKRLLSWWKGVPR